MYKLAIASYLGVELVGGVGYGISKMQSGFF
uniref:Uncharacterized protein n=1 Tax=Nelumbo nucifera TaxID=4432 RepID=A0A822ZCQ9_NELNU|nr:TPA_asm: hypothetical protein HUJ06_002234 [Nelumbo nucifera]